MVGVDGPWRPQILRSQCYWLEKKTFLSRLSLSHNFILALLQGMGCTLYTDTLYIFFSFLLPLFLLRRFFSHCHRCTHSPTPTSDEEEKREKEEEAKRGDPSSVGAMNIQYNQDLDSMTD